MCAHSAQYSYAKKQLALQKSVKRFNKASNCQTIANYSEDIRVRSVLPRLTLIACKINGTIFVFAGFLSLPLLLDWNWLLPHSKIVTIKKKNSHTHTHTKSLPRYALHIFKCIENCIWPVLYDLRGIEWFSLSGVIQIIHVLPFSSMKWSVV